jgi:hypothetical protein
MAEVKSANSKVYNNSGGNGNRAAMSPGSLAIAEMLKVVGTPAMQHCNLQGTLPVKRSL